MLDELTPLQAYELFAYSATEPFGELRNDYRMAAQMQQRYDIARGKHGRHIALGEFVLYKDVAEASKQAKTDAQLIQTLDRMATRKSVPRERIVYGK